MIGLSPAVSSADPAGKRVRWKCSYSVLAAVAEGHHTRGAIARFVGRRDDALQHPLTVLEDAGLLRRDPDAFRASRSRVRSTEPLITFYHAVMRPEWARLERPGQAETVWADARACFDSAVLGPHFEQLCRDWVTRFVDDASVGGRAGQTFARSYLPQAEVIIGALGTVGRAVRAIKVGLDASADTWEGCDQGAAGRFGGRRCPVVAESRVGRSLGQYRWRAGRDHQPSPEAGQRRLPAADLTGARPRRLIGAFPPWLPAGQRSVVGSQLTPARAAARCPPRRVAACAPGSSPQLRPRRSPAPQPPPRGSRYPLRHLGRLTR